MFWGMGGWEGVVSEAVVFAEIGGVVRSARERIAQGVDHSTKCARGELRVGVKLGFGALAGSGTVGNHVGRGDGRADRDRFAMELGRANIDAVEDGITRRGVVELGKASGADGGMEVGADS